MCTCVGRGGLRETRRLALRRPAGFSEPRASHARPSWALSLLFGSIVGISRAQVCQTGLLAVGCLLALAVLYRPLLLSSRAPRQRRRGVPIRLLSVLFLVVVGVAAAVTVPVAGTLMIFALMVGPAGAALHWRAGRPRPCSWRSG